jgi:hypothetical protein
MNTDMSQEEAAVIAAVDQVRQMTGFGRVTIDIKEGRVVFIEISATVLIKRSDGTVTGLWQPAEKP